MSDERVVFHVECADCDEAEQTTTLEHADGSQQEELVKHAHQQLVEEHREETGHEVELNKEVKNAN